MWSSFGGSSIFKLSRREERWYWCVVEVVREERL